MCMDMGGFNWYLVICVNIGKILRVFGGVGYF